MLAEDPSLTLRISRQRDFLSPSSIATAAMDKKIKKKIDLNNQKLQRLRQQLAGAKQQNDEPGEIERLESEIAALKEEVEKLKAS